MSLIFSGQFETDKFILEYFPNKLNGVAVDVGAVDGRYMSNTLYFEENLGWEVLCIEPNPRMYEELVKNRKYALNVAVSDTDEDDTDFHVFSMSDGNESSVSSLVVDQKLIDYHINEYNIKLNHNVIKVPVRTLETCLSQFPFSHVDFLSIDTEGTELQVLKGFNIRFWNPTLLVIENNWDENTQNVSEYLSDYGYGLDKRIGVNDFFIKL